MHQAHRSTLAAAHCWAHLPVLHAHAFPASGPAPAGRRQVLEEQRLVEAEAAAEAERARERQQEGFTLMLKKAAREGHTAGARVRAGAAASCARACAEAM